MTLKMKLLLGVASGGAVSSVVEHFLDTEGVRGSNPLSRTKPSHELPTNSCTTIKPARVKGHLRMSREKHQLAPPVDFWTGGFSVPDPLAM
jgi:hypothetical protein